MWPLVWRRPPANVAQPDRVAVAKRLNDRRLRRIEFDPLLALRGSGRSLWADEHADDYIRRLRSD
jgi:hypothetical protein